MCDCDETPKKKPSSLDLFVLVIFGASIIMLLVGLSSLAMVDKIQDENDRLRSELLDRDMCTYYSAGQFIVTDSVKCDHCGKTTYKGFHGGIYLNIKDIGVKCVIDTNDNEWYPNAIH